MFKADTNELVYALCELLDDRNLAVQERNGVAAVFRREDPQGRPEAVTDALPERDGYAICAIWDMGNMFWPMQGIRRKKRSSLPPLPHGAYPPIWGRWACRWIGEALEKGEEEAVIVHKRSWYGDSLCSIGKEEPARLSLIRTRKGADVKFAKRYVAQGVDAAMGYTVLDRCCRLLEIADKLCQKVLEAGIAVNQETLKCLMVFGDTAKKRKWWKREVRP